MSAAGVEPASRQPSGVLSVLGLLHPDGIAARVQVVGGNCPQRLAPQPEPAFSSFQDGPVDLLIVAPTAAECRGLDWHDRLNKALERQIARDGIVYVLAPVRERASIRRLLGIHGLVVEPPLVHLPTSAVSDYLIPLTRPAIAYALAGPVVSRKWKRRAILAGLRMNGLATLASVLPSVGMVARRPGDRPALEWLFRIDGLRDSGTGLIAINWRAERTSAVVHRIPGQARQGAIAKLALSRTGPSLDFANEAAALTRLAPIAAAAGVSVPVALASGRLGSEPVLLETVVAGQSLAGVLWSSPQRTMAMMAKVAGWLERWNCATSAPRPAPGELGRLLADPARQLVSVLQNGEAYSSWLAARCSNTTGLLPLVTAHNDLTTYNILVDEHDRLGILDWAAAHEMALPLVDFFYFITDSVVMASRGPGHLHRSDALAACIAPHGSYRTTVLPLLRRFTRVLGVPREVVDLCLHACFVGHALNEHRAAASGAARPFGEVANWVVANRDNIKYWLTA